MKNLINVNWIYSKGPVFFFFFLVVIVFKIKKEIGVYVKMSPWNETHAMQFGIK